VRRKRGRDNAVVENQKAKITAFLGRLTGFTCTVARQLSRRCTFGEFEPLAVNSRRR
jgi:hypothetical protein